MKARFSGRTQQLNFFRPTAAGGSGFHVVDLPGYGFAAKNAKADRLQWQVLVGDLMRHPASNVRCVFVLLDCRRGLFPADHEFMQFLDDCGIQFKVVLTKADKVSLQSFEKKYK